MIDMDPDSSPSTCRPAGAEDAFCATVATRRPRLPALRRRSGTQSFRESPKGFNILEARLFLGGQEFAHADQRQQNGFLPKRRAELLRTGRDFRVIPFQDDDLDRVLLLAPEKAFASNDGATIKAPFDPDYSLNRGVVPLRENSSRALGCPCGRSRPQCNNVLRQHPPNCHRGRRLCEVILRRIIADLRLGLATAGCSLTALPPEGHKAGMRSVLWTCNKRTGMSTAEHRTFVYRGCPFIKVEVDFTLSDPEQGPLQEESTDTISRISKPYLEWGVRD